MDVQVASDLSFGRFTYAHKDNKITFLMQLVSCQNSFEINENHQNNILTLATDNDDVIMPDATVVGCYAIVDLVPPRSPKLGLANLKTAAH
jgi:hypothetical protein